MARKFVCAYFDWLQTLRKCTDAELGRILRGALAYARDGTQPSFAEGSREELFWDGIAAQIDRDSAKYDKRAKAGTKGMENRWNKPSQKVEEKATEPPANIREYIDKITAWKDAMGGESDNKR